MPHSRSDAWFHNKFRQTSTLSCIMPICHSCNARTAACDRYFAINHNFQRMKTVIRLDFEFLLHSMLALSMLCGGHLNRAKELLMIWEFWPCFVLVFPPPAQTPDLNRPLAHSKCWLSKSESLQICPSVCLQLGPAFDSFSLSASLWALYRHHSSSFFQPDSFIQELSCATSTRQWWR